MSELQRSFAKAKLAGLPYEPPLPINDLPEDDEDEEADNLKPLPEQNQDDDSSSASSASSASSTGTIRPSPSKHLFARHRGFVVVPPFHKTLICFLCIPKLRMFFTSGRHRAPRDFDEDYSSESLYICIDPLPPRNL